MTIKTLIEDTDCFHEYKKEHGLSFYIETSNHKILFDMGDSSLFLENAEKMGVDIKEVDIAIISHGHYDHGGGLSAFFNVNSKAKVYIHKKAFVGHFAKRSNGKMDDIGLDSKLQESDRFIFVGDALKIDEELELFSHVSGQRCIAFSNQVLFQKEGVDLVQDTFDHEQSLVIRENDKTVLIAGCAHKGILNILDRFNELGKEKLDVVIGGFHLSNPSLGTSEATDLIDEIAHSLIETDSFYYTCHCTGLEPYERLKEVMKDQIQYLTTGSVVEI